jgi:hypothetical protein
VPTTTLRVLREEVARGLGVRSFVDGSVPTLGTTAILPDPNRLEPDGEWSDVDAFVLFTSSPLDGQVRRVTGFTTGTSVQFGPAVATAVPSGALYQIFKSYHPIEDHNIAINDALRELGMRRVTSVGTTTETSGVQGLPVPSVVANTSTDLLRVERSVGTLASPYDYEDLVQGYHYELVRNNGAAWLELKYFPVTGQVVRFTYSREATTLTADTDATDEPVLLVKALARKYLAAANKDDAGVTRWAREAERIRHEVIPSTQTSRKLVVPKITVSGNTDW